MRSKKKISLTWVYVGFAVIILGLLIWSSTKALRETPTRETSLEIPGEGWVTFSLTTNPFPPLPTGTVALALRASNSRGVMINLGESLPYSFGSTGSKDVFQNGFVIRNGSSYQAGVIFPTPGNYWLRFDLDDGNLIEFQIYVEPAQ